MVDFTLALCVHLHLHYLLNIKDFFKKKETLSDAFKMVSSFHISYSWFFLYPVKDCVNFQKTQSPFPSPVLHFNLSIHFSAKCWAEARGTIIVNGHHFIMDRKCYLNITKLDENYVLLNKKGFTCSSNMQRVSKKAFWMPGAQLRKQYVYEQAFPSAPRLCLRMTTHSDTLTQTGL